MSESLRNNDNPAAMNDRSAAEYARRMNQVIDYVDRHLSEPVELGDLAAVANFSAFHFHRLFSSWMGETLGSYLRRRRLEVGALKLAHDQRKSVLEVALEVGFGSGEAFSRAFKLQFGTTPTQWRLESPERWVSNLAARRAKAANSNLDQAMRKHDQVSADASNHDDGSLFQEFDMEVQILTLPPARVAFMRRIGPYGIGVNQFWLNKFLPWMKAQGLEKATCYGIGHDDPDITPADKCRYDACVEVPDDFIAQGSVGVTVLPGGRYAVARFKGSLPAFGVAWAELMRSWLPSSGMQADSRPFFERYSEDASYDPDTGIVECELCLPVRPL